MKTRNFRTKLLLMLVPLSAVVVIFLAFVAQYLAGDELVNAEFNKLELIVEKSVKELDNWFANRIKFIKTVRQLDLLKDAIQKQEYQTATELLKKMHKYYPVYENIFLADAKGVIRADSIAGKTVGVDLKQVASPNYQASSAGKIHIGEVMVAPATKLPVVLITAPLTVDGKVVGLVGTPVSLIAFYKQNMEFKIGKSGYLVLLGPKSRFLAHPDPKNVMKTWDFGSTLLAAKQGRVRYTFEGIEKIAWVETWKKKNWVMFTATPIDEVMAGVNRIRSWAALVGLLSVLLIVGVIIYGTGNVFKVLKKTSLGLFDSSSQIAMASDQVAAASTSLAEQASESSSSLEETSASLEEMTATIKANADNAREADKLSAQAQTAAREGGEVMNNMLDLMNRINSASEETAGIIKSIDELAFQTNLLALNAAIEAARAGDAGAGFAVVAEEVRSLAAKSAAAAKDTNERIEVSREATAAGLQVSNQVAESLQQILDKVQKVTGLVNEVASASNEQAKGIDQINTAVAEMNQGTQAIAASAEETSSASEELSAQSEELNSMVAELNLLTGQQVAQLQRESGAGSGRRQPEPHRERSLQAQAATRPVQQQTKVPARKPAGKKGSELTPEQVIPLDNDDYGDF